MLRIFWRESKEGYIETKTANGIAIPKPLELEKFSGKFVLRIPKFLHYRLVLEAEKEGVSLNQYGEFEMSIAFDGHIIVGDFPSKQQKLVVLYFVTRPG